MAGDMFWTVKCYFYLYEDVYVCVWIYKHALGGMSSSYLC